VRTATIIDGAARRPVVVDPERGALPVDVVLPELTGDAMGLIDLGAFVAAAVVAVVLVRRQSRTKVVA
jgi:hypothetical protein